MTDYLAAFFGTTTLVLSYYVYKYHSRHFAEKCLDKYLNLKHSTEDIIQIVNTIRPQEANNSNQSQIKITDINLIDLTTPQPQIISHLKVTETTSLPKTIPENHLIHITYQYQDQPYRLVLNHHQKSLIETKQLYDLLQTDEWIENGIEVGIDDIESSQQESEHQPIDENIIKQYAGPLQDFYQSLPNDLNLQPDPRGLLNHDLTDFLLKPVHPLTASTLTVTTSLGEEYTFSSSRSASPTN